MTIREKIAPAGYVTVPVEPTEAMVAAGRDRALNTSIATESGGWPGYIRGQWDAMLKAAPPAPAQNPDRILKDALFAMVAAGRGPEEYTGVLIDIDEGVTANIRFTHEPSAHPASTGQEDKP